MYGIIFLSPYNCIIFIVGEAINEDSILEKEPLPVSNDTGSSEKGDALSKDDDVLKLETDKMKEQVERYLENKDQKRVDAKKKMASDLFTNVSDAEKAKLTATINGVSSPTRKSQSEEDPTKYGFSSISHYEWYRYTLIIPLIESADEKDVPLFTEQCVRVLMIVSPKDLHVIWSNHCATQYQRGHCNLHSGNGCCGDYNMKDCVSVIAMREIAKYFSNYTAIQFEGEIEDVQCVNLFEFCLTKGTRFQRCPRGTEAKTIPLLGIFNLFLKALSGLEVNTIVASSAGRTCGVEELLLDKLESRSERIMIIRQSLWHLQFNLVQHQAKTLQETAVIMTNQWQIFSSHFMMPSLKKAGIEPTKTIVEYMIDNKLAIFVTNDPTQLIDELSEKNSETKEKRIDNLLQACRKALKDDNDAPVDGQVLIIQRYAQNHWSEIKERIGVYAPNSWHYLYVRELLSNMGKNGQEERVKRHGLGDVLKQLSAARKARCADASASLVEAKELRMQLATSGECFWLKASKGDILAEKGKKMSRIYKGKTYYNFPKIQVSHGQFKSVEDLHYLECHGDRDDAIAHLTYGTLSQVCYRYQVDGYRLKIPFGMFTKSEENGNVLLAWYERKG